MDDAKVFDEAIVSENAVVKGNSEIFNKTEVSGNDVIDGDAKEVSSISIQVPLEVFRNEDGKSQENMQIIIQKAANGDADAQYQLGEKYRYGIGIDKNIEKTVYWYTKAADQGHANAQHWLGRMYLKGRDVKQDLGKAISLISKAAEAGLGRAQYNLAVMYEEGIGIEKNLNKAMHWYMKSIEQGEDDAMFRLDRIEVQNPIQENASKDVRIYTGNVIVVTKNRVLQQISKTRVIAHDIHEITKYLPDLKKGQRIDVSISENRIVGVQPSEKNKEKKVGLER